MTEKVSMARQFALILFLFVLCTAILSMEYPIWREFRYQRYPTVYWIRVYLQTALALLLVYLLAGWAIRIGKAKHAVILQSVIFFVVVAAAAVFFGTRTAEQAQMLPDLFEDSDAKFLAEWGFVTFIFKVVLPFSILAVPIQAFAAKCFRKQ